MQELGLNRDTVRFIIDKAHGFHVQEGVTFPEDQPLSPSEDWAQQVLAAHGDDPTLQEFKAVVDELDREQQIALVALTWVGRGDFTADEWDQAVETATDGWNPRTAEYLIGMPLLADYLGEGLAQFGYDLDDED
jgi:hypothetical protein